MSILRRNVPALLGLLLVLLLCVSLTPAAWADGSTAATLQAAVDRGDSSFTLTGDLTIPSGTAIITRATTVIVPKGRTLTLDGGILDLSALRLEGGRIEVRNRAILRVDDAFGYTGGSVEIYSGYNLFPAADILPDNTGVISYPDGAGTTTLRFVPTNDSEFASAVAAINGLAENFEANITVDGDLTLTSRHTLTHKTFVSIFGTLTLAEGSQLEYAGCSGTVSLQNPQPDGEGGAIVNDGVLLVNALNLAPGCHVRSNHVMETGSLDLGGSVEVGGGIFRINNKLNCSGGTVAILDKCFNYFPAADVLALEDYKQVLLYPNGEIRTNLGFRPSNDSQAMAALETANGLDELFFADIGINFPWYVSGEAKLTHQAELRINGGSGGRLTVKEGASFTKDGGGNIFLENNGDPDCGAFLKVNGKMTVGNLSVAPGCALLLEDGGVLTTAKLEIKGRFAHNGMLVLRGKPASDPEPRLVLEGDYEYGDGMIYVMDLENLDSYFAKFDTSDFEKSALDKGMLYAPWAVDLVLPAKLRGIGEEAFAENGFLTVFIPAGVKDIDASAFAGIEGLCVVGYADSEAQRFAAENGFEFTALS